MGPYLIRRAFHGALTLLALVTVVFFVVHMIGDPARLMLPLSATPEEIAALSQRLGLADPVYVQYVRFLGQAAQGDLGTSLWRNAPTLPLVVERLPATFLLTGTVIVLASLIGVALGLLTAVKRHSPLRRALTLLSFTLVSIPEFWLGLSLIMLLALAIPLFPTSGYGGPRFIVLPALTLMARPIGRLSEVTRAAAMDQMSQDYVRTAAAKGLPGSIIWWRHIGRNAAIPVITIIGDEIVLLVNGAVVVETVFGWPGVGILTMQAIVERDLPLVVAAVVVTGAAVILVNLATDLAYALFNPRVRYR